MLIAFPDTSSRPIFDLQIGIDYLQLHSSYKYGRAREGEPIARRTPLEWTCVVYPEGNIDHDVNTYFSQMTLFTVNRSGSDVDEINSTLQKFWYMDSAGIVNQKTVVDADEEIALKKAEKSFKFINGRYEIGIPWKTELHQMENNYKIVMKRIQNTGKHLLRKLDLMKAYEEVIDSYLDKGYIRKVPVTDNQPGCKWYLPHFGILKPSKTTTKLRIFLDASAKYEGRSLNDMIYSGPKLQGELFGV